MKKIVLINGIEDSVYTPVFQSVAKDIAKNLGLGNVPIVNKDNNLLEKDGIGATTLDKNLHNTYLQINYSIDPSPEVEAYNIPLNPDTKPFFKDDTNKVKMTTAYRDAKFNFEINVKSKSKSVVGKVSDLLYSRQIAVDRFDSHNIQFSYTIPKIAKLLMYELHSILKEYEDIKLEDYLAKNLDKEQIDIALSLSGNPLRNSLMVKEYQLDITGEYLGTLDAINTDKDDLYYVLPLNYHFTIKRPLTIHLEYPYIVFNRTLSDRFKEKYYRKPVGKYIGYEESLEKLLKKYDSFGISKTGYYIKYPSYDEYQIEFKIGSYTTILTVLNIVDKDNPYELFNIKDLPNFKFKENVLKLILENKENISKYLKGLFYFNLYVNNDGIMDECITIDDDGNLRTTFPMEMKNTYRVGIHLCENISCITTAEKEKIKRFINDEIADNIDKERVKSDFGVEKQKVSIRLNKDNEKGIEVYKTEPLFFDIYLDMFDVSKSEVTNAINNFGTTQSPGEILFKIKVPDFGWPKLSNRHHVKLHKLFDIEP